MAKSRCPYFSISMGRIPLPDHRAPLHVPLCRCTLTETFVSRLRTHPAGHTLASHLEGEMLDGQRRPLIGPDLQPITAQTCTALTL